MSTLKDIAEFRSAKFSPVLPEECQVNPRVYGAELAYWLGGELARAGIATGYPQWEDWGWYIEYQTDDGSEFAVHCCNTDEDGEEWLLSLRRFGRKMFGRDKPPFSDAAALVDAVKECLESEPSITQLEWRFSTPDHSGQ